MQRHITPDEMLAAARQLAKTERGRAALVRLAGLLADDDLPLSLLDQRAFLALLGGAWKGQGASVRQAIQNGSAAYVGETEGREAGLRDAALPSETKPPRKTTRPRLG